MVYAKGKSVFELIDPDGHIYVLQAHDAQFPIESLAKLGEQIRLAAYSGPQLTTAVGLRTIGGPPKNPSRNKEMLTPVESRDRRFHSTTKI
jgi:hypothetical protein